MLLLLQMGMMGIYVSLGLEMIETTIVDEAVTGKEFGVDVTTSRSGKLGCFECSDM